jgi:hypothetical protein
MLAAAERMVMVEPKTVDEAFALVEQAWKLSDEGRDYVKRANREVPPQEIVEKVFLPSGLVDVARTQKEGGNPPKVFLESPYGLQYRPEQKDWIPFRHGPLNIPLS